jgi:hypothetical protein
MSKVEIIEPGAANKIELVNVFRLTAAERVSVLAALLGALDLRAYRVTKPDGHQYFGVVSKYDCVTSVTPIDWADGHGPVVSESLKDAQHHD